MKLIVVSNREPYVHKKTGNTISLEKPAGGLTSALDNVLKTLKGTWIAWGSGSGDREVVDRRSCVFVPPSGPSYTLKRVWLNQNEIDNYYAGYSNRVLWPLSHLTLDRVYYKKQYWDYYRKVNRKFADAVIEEIGQDSTETFVWIHDFHLCFVPLFVKETLPLITIGHFWHIPWPDWSTFRILPQARDILEGLLANDLIGFQIPLFVKNFMNCVKEGLNADIDYENKLVLYNGHKTHLGSFPISVDFDSFNSMALSKTQYSINHLKKQLGIKDEYIGIGVDRLEYTKALLKRLQAIDLFFEKYRSLIGRFTFIQIAVPTRLSEPYISYKKSVEEYINRINNKYSTGSWKPIIYITTKIEHKDLALYYRISDVAIISSVYDGMNLVAKEYIASQVDEKGVIILSEFAGASEELTGALPLNPYDIETFAETIKKALLMPIEEKRNRIRALREYVKNNNLKQWTDSFLDALKKCHQSEQGKANGVFLFFDYDGTLTPIVDTPQAAVLDEGMRALLNMLKSKYPIAIISGRSLVDIMGMVNIKDIIYAGNHGAEIWDGKNIIKGNINPVDIALLHEFKERISTALKDIGGVMVEDKTVTLSIHYRNVKQQDIENTVIRFWNVANSYKERLKITEGKKVFEVRLLNAWNKGDAVLWILKNFGAGKIPIYIGDDSTDEDAFNPKNAFAK
ncbi:MAG: bifunctional alpha,alpha-trehalose-phosphate synthase (UDP-forming)/trehalose-phosphatase [bacterium]